jgi:hypothetical protein
MAYDEDKDLVAMRGILDKTPNADIVIRGIASLERTDKTTDLRRLQVRIQKVLGVTLRTLDIETVFKEFQGSGWGKLKVERGSGAHSRFSWDPRIKYTQLALAAVGTGPQTVLGRTGIVTGAVGRQVPSPAALVLTLRSGRELRLTLDDARDLKAQLATL